MKQNIIRTLLACALVCIGAQGWAQRVYVAGLTNGQIEVGDVEESGDVTVTLTVTPADDYYIELSDIVVSKTTSVAQAPSRSPRRTPTYTDKPEVLEVDVDERGVGTYEFTLPDGYGAYVEATFHACIAIEPEVDILGWTYGDYDAETNTPSVTGNTGDGDVTYTYSLQGQNNYEENVPENAGDYTVKASIAARGHYLAGEATKDFTVDRKALESSMIGALGAETYTGDEIEPEVTVTYNEEELVEDDDYEVEYSDNCGAGTATVTITAIDNTNYSGSAQVTFTINPKALEDSMIEAIDDEEYNGNEKTPDLTVTYNDMDLYVNQDYTASYTNNTHAGTATVTITAITGEGKNYSGSAQATFTINRAEGFIGFMRDYEQKTYGDEAFTNALFHEGDGTVSYESSNTDVATVDETGEVTIVGAGEATITATVTEKDDGDYTYYDTDEAFDLNVLKTQLTVTANDNTITYGDEAANNGVEYDGFAYEEDESVLNGTLVYAYKDNGNNDYAVGSPVGTYTIKLSGLESDNYYFVYEDGEMEVEQKEVGLEWDTDTFDADGTEKLPVATATELVGDDECEVEVEGEATDVGSYTATAIGLSNPNYMLPEVAIWDFDIVRDMSQVFADGCEWATYVAQEDLATPEGLTAYVVGSVTATDVNAEAFDYIPVGIGILLHRNDVNASTYKGEAYTDAPADIASLLVGDATDTSEPQDYTDFVLYNDEFVLAGSSVVVGAGHAYLPAANVSNSAARRFGINAFGEATGIKNVALSGDEGAWYTLTGAKLSGKPAKKGVYINNGKKVFMK